MERFGEIGEEVVKGFDKEGEEFIFLFPVEEGVAWEHAMKVKDEVRACTSSMQKEVQSAMREVLQAKMNKCLAECLSFVASSPESVNAVVRGTLMQTYYEELANVMRDMGTLKKTVVAFGEDVVNRLHEEGGVAGAFRDFLKAKGVDEGIVLLRKRIDEAFTKAVADYTPKVRDYIKDRQEVWVIAEGAIVLKSFLLNRNWTVAPLSEPQGKEEIDTWEQFEKYFDDAFGDAVVELNKGVEAEWEIQKISLAESFTTLGTEDLKKMKACFVKDIYYPRARAVMQMEVEDDSSSPPKSPVRTEAKSDEIEGSKKSAPKVEKHEDKAETAKRADKKGIKERAPPASPCAAKRAKDSKLVGKRTVAEMLAYGMNEGTATGVNGQVYVIDLSQTKVLSLTCMDNTMVVQLIVSKEHVAQVTGLLRGWEIANVDVPALINFRGGKLKTNDGKPNTHVRIELEAGAVVELAKGQEETTSKCDVGTLNGSHFVSVFADLSGCTPPFILTTEGVICKFSTSNAGAAQTQGFYLQDENADMLKFLAHGAWADSEVLKIGNRVRIFFAKAQYGRGEYARQATLWIFEDAYIHVLASDQSTKHEGKTISFG